MRLHKLFLFGFLFTWLLMTGPSTAVYLGDGEGTADPGPPTQLVVKYRAHDDSRTGRCVTAAELSKSVDVRQLNQQYGVTEERKLLLPSILRTPDLGLEDVYVLTVPPGTDVEAMAVEYRQLDAVEYAVPNYQM